jgi:phospholipase/lecithinase/hemolysin
METTMKIQRGRGRRILFVGLLSCAIALPAIVHAQGRISEIVIFGDSLSDTGNAFALQKVNNTPPSYSVDLFLIPDDAYARGGHHFTNGATWAEDFARPLGLAADVNPAFRDADPRATNYAVGGARAFDDGTCKSFNLPCQVQIFLQDFGGSAPADALYVIEIGGNDLRDALATGDPSLINAALGSVFANIQTLYQAGARKFLVWNAPDIGLTPAIRSLGPVAMAAASAAALGYKTGLDGVLASLEALPGIAITEFDLFGTLHAIVANPSAVGLNDVTDACISPNDPPFVCKNPDTYLFWDGIHPTKAAHAILAQAVAQSLQ